MKYLVFCLLFSFSISAFTQNADINLLRKINIDRNTSLDPSMKFISNYTSAVTIASPLVVYSLGLLKSDSLLKRKAWYIGEAIVGTTILTVALKYSINRDRPFTTYPDIVKLGSGGSPSFPSGHTAEAFSTATSLSIAFPKWYVIAPAYLWAGSVGYSRMHLGVHYPSDVLAGAILGAGTAYLTYRVNRWIRKSAKRNN